ncbi:MAG: hypothetical protein ABEN55_23410, partial [Bradymonadaceae bacterium]
MSAERRRTPTLTAAAFLTLTLVAMGVVGACDRGGDDSSGESRAVTPDERGHDETNQKAQPGSGGEEEGGEEHGHEHGEHE